LHNIVTFLDFYAIVSGMGNPAGVRRDFDKLEQRRLEGAELLRQGVPQAEVARRVGVHRQSVSRWAEQLQRGGKRAMRKAGRAGRKPRLRPQDLRRIEKGLKRGPEALGYETSLWTSWRVAHLIEYECEVKYHPSQAWRILRQLGWSCQRPIGRALEREEEKIRAWKQKRWPEIKKVQNERRTIVFIDESGLSERPHRCRTWASKGTNTGPTISLQLEDAVGDGGRDVVEFSLPTVSRRDPLS
jgi:transposase